MVFIGVLIKYYYSHKKPGKDYETIKAEVKGVNTSEYKECDTVYLYDSIAIYPYYRIKIVPAEGPNTIEMYYMASDSTMRHKTLIIDQ